MSGEAECTDNTNDSLGNLGDLTEDHVLDELSGKMMPWSRYRAMVGGRVCHHQHRSLDRAFKCLINLLAAYIRMDTAIGWDWMQRNGVSAEKITIEIAVVDERGNPVSYESAKHFLAEDRLF